RCQEERKPGVNRRDCRVITKLCMREVHAISHKSETVPQRAEFLYDYVRIRALHLSTHRGRNLLGCHANANQKSGTVKADAVVVTAICRQWLTVRHIHQRREALLQIVELANVCHDPYHRVPRSNLITALRTHTLAYPRFAWPESRRKGLVD